MTSVPIRLAGGRPDLAGDRDTAADMMSIVVADFVKSLKLKLPEDAEPSRRWYETVSARGAEKARLKNGPKSLEPPGNKVLDPPPPRTYVP